MPIRARSIPTRAGAESLSAGTSTELDTHGREAALRAPTLIRGDRKRRGKCCVSSSSIRSHSRQIRVSPFACRFLDAGMPTLSARSCSRRPKSAKAGNRGAIARSSGGAMGILPAARTWEWCLRSATRGILLRGWFVSRGTIARWGVCAGRWWLVWASLREQVGL
jgi:hypothetical protein